MVLLFFHMALIFLLNKGVLDGCYEMGETKKGYLLCANWRLHIGGDKDFASRGGGKERKKRRKKKRNLSYSQILFPFPPPFFFLYQVSTVFVENGKSLPQTRLKKETFSPKKHS